MTDTLQASPDAGLPMNEVSSVVPEKTLTQEQVNSLVGHAKAEAYRKGKNEAMAELQKQTQPSSSSPDDLRKLVAEETHRALESTRKQYEEQAYLATANQILGQFQSKISAAKQEYPDIEKTLESLQLDKISEILPLANATENTADVMVDLANNPHKLASVLLLAQRAPHLAQAEMNRLSNSIKANKAAVSAKVANEPLSQPNPSIVAPDSGEKDVAYFKRQSWMKV